MTVRLTHPDGGSISARDDMAAMYETAGWTRGKTRETSAPAKRAVKKSAAKKATPSSTSTQKAG